MRWPRRRTRPNPALQAARQHMLAGGQALESQRWAVAVEQFEKALEAVPELVEAHVNAGSACYQAALGSSASEADLWLSRAQRHFEAALVQRPDSVPAALNLAATLHGRGAAAEALAVLEALARDHPQATAVHYNLALAYANAGRIPEARAALATELALDPTNAAALELGRRLDAAEA